MAVSNQMIGSICWWCYAAFYLFPTVFIILSFTHCKDVRNVADTKTWSDVKIEQKDKDKEYSTWTNTEKMSNTNLLKNEDKVYLFYMCDLPCNVQSPENVVRDGIGLRRCKQTESHLLWNRHWTTINQYMMTTVQPRKQGFNRTVINSCLSKLFISNNDLHRKSREGAHGPCILY
jgi:hypothetical protein